LAFSHNLHLCHDKGRDGSPTYDEAGFQLDYDKVAQWMKPRANNKKQILRNRDGELSRLEREKDQIFKLFFVEVPDKLGLHQEDLVKDHMSKDLGFAWHQIKPKHVKTWKEKGFQPVKFEDWWKKPTAEEQKRFRKMSAGALLRKDL
jgi:hypothetical protein